jgi:hypothetical protein
VNTAEPLKEEFDVKERKQNLTKELLTVGSFFPPVRTHTGKQCGTLESLAHDQVNRKSK